MRVMGRKKSMRRVAEKSGFGNGVCLLYVQYSPAQMRRMIIIITKKFEVAAIKQKTKYDFLKTGFDYLII